MSTNTTVRLARRPEGEPSDDIWEIVDEPVPEAGPGRFVVRVQCVSIDPAMRGWLDDVPSYLPPVRIGDVMRALTVGEVVESQHSRFPVGTIVQGTFGVQDYAVSDGREVTIVDPALGTASMYLGVLGSTGLTAYYGLLQHGRPRAGDTVVVSAAAGGVGSIVGQLARISGCRVVGIAGGPEKCRYLVDTLGFDAAVDYRQAGLRRNLAESCPSGIDVYFDNVGGQILDSALSLLAMHARVVVCGAIAQYNATERQPGPSNYLSLLVRRASMSGFLYFDHAVDFPVARRRLAAWVSDGSIIAPETIATGTVKDFPATLRRLFSGDNLGKLVLDIADRSSA